MTQCDHMKSGRHTWNESGKAIDGQVEYICQLCGMKHLPSEEEILIGKFFPDPYEVKEFTIEDPNKVFEILFKQFITKQAMIFHKTVREGTVSSCSIYVPKIYKGSRATVILWPRKGEEGYE